MYTYFKNTKYDLIFIILFILHNILLFKHYVKCNFKRFMRICKIIKE